MSYQNFWSLPLRERGLKSNCPTFLVTAWCRSPCGSVDWNIGIPCECTYGKCRSPCGSVDWNHLLPCSAIMLRGRSPCGSVDWNGIHLFIFSKSFVAPLAGAWIEIEQLEMSLKKDLVAPLAGAWIEIYRDRPEGSESKVAPLAGAWIEISLAVYLHSL